MREGWRRICPIGVLFVSVAVAWGCAETGEGGDPSFLWGDATRGVQTRLSLEKTAFSLREPLRATIEIRVEEGSGDGVTLSRTGIQYMVVGTDGYGGAMFIGTESSMATRRMDDGRVYTATIDLAESYPFVPRINTDYQVSVGCQVGYSGSKAVWANSPPVTLRVDVPRERVLDYYLSELTADRPREFGRQRGDWFPPYPVDELLKLGKPALEHLETLCRIARDRERLERLIYPLRFFGDEGLVALQRLSRDAEGDLEVLVGFELRYWNRKEER